MPDQEACRAIGRLEPPVGAAFYNTIPLAGGKRQRADDGDEGDTATWFGSAIRDPQSQQMPGEGNNLREVNNLGDVCAVVRNSVIYTDAPNPSRVTKAPANVKIKKNKTRNTNNDLEVLINGSWHKAIYHNEYVNDIGTQRLYQSVYTYGRNPGRLGTYDRTAYLEEQKDWGKARANRPTILFEFKQPANRYTATNPLPYSRVVSGTWKVVIDVINNKPLRDFRHIPITISTNVEGWLQEAWFRQDPSLQAEDLIQRMPYTAEHKVYETRRVINRLVRRRELFRDEGRCLSWKKTEWTKKWDLQLIEEMSRNPNNASPNSTRHLKDLTVDEKQTLKDQTYDSGEHRVKAGKRALRGHKKEKKVREVKQRLAKAQIERPKATFDDEGGDWDAEQTQSDMRTSKPRNTQAIHNTIGRQPQQQVTSSSLSTHDSSQISHQSCQSLNPRLKGRVEREPKHVQLPKEVHWYPGPSANPQAMGKPMMSGMSGRRSDAQSALHTANYQKFIQQSHQQSMNVATHPNMMGNRQAYQQFQSQRQHNAYDDEFGGMPSMPDEIFNPYGMMRRAFSYAPSSNFAEGPLNNEVRSQSCPVHQHGQQNSYVNQLQQQSVPNHQHLGQNDIVDKYPPQSSAIDPNPTYARHSSDLMYSGPAFDRPEELQFGTVEDPLDLLMQQPYTGATLLDDNGTVWADVHARDSASQTHDPVLHINSSEQAASYRQYEVMKSNCHARLDYHDDQSSIPTGMSHLSSRKHGFEEDLDSDFAGPARKSRKLC